MKPTVPPEHRPATECPCKHCEVVNRQRAEVEARRQAVPPDPAPPTLDPARLVKALLSIRCPTDSHGGVGSACIVALGGGAYCADRIRALTGAPIPAVADDNADLRPRET